jgi:hypothetical protein
VDAFSFLKSSSDFLLTFWGPTFFQEVVKDIARTSYNLHIMNHTLAALALFCSDSVNELSDRKRNEVYNESASKYPKPSRVLF